MIFYIIFSRPFSLSNKFLFLIGRDLRIKARWLLTNLRRKKRSCYDGWCAPTMDTLLKNMNKNKAMRTGAVTLWFMNLWISTTRLQRWSWPIYTPRKCLPFKTPVLMIIDSFKSGSWLISFGEFSFSWFFFHPVLFLFYLSLIAWFWFETILN